MTSNGIPTTTQLPGAERSNSLLVLRTVKKTTALAP